MNTSRYSLITILPHPERLDRIVLGIAVISGREWKVVLTGNYGKLLALNPNYDLSVLFEFKVRLEELAYGCENLDQLRTIMKLIGTSLQLDKFEGRFAYEDELSKSIQINRIMAESVNAPEVFRTYEKRQRSELRFNLKKQFDQLGILAKDISGIDEHKVVPQYPIEASQGLYADFALKNSFMHVTATVDFTMSEQAFTAKKYETQAKCLVLKAAEEICGTNKTRKYVIVAGSDRRNSQAALNLLRANATVYRFEDSNDMAEYLNVIQSAAFGSPPLH